MALFNLSIYNSSLLGLLSAFVSWKLIYCSQSILLVSVFKYYKGWFHQCMLRNIKKTPVTDDLVKGIAFLFLFCILYSPYHEDTFGIRSLYLRQLKWSPFQITPNIRPPHLLLYWTGSYQTVRFTHGINIAGSYQTVRFTHGINIAGSQLFSGSSVRTISVPSVQSICICIE